jgi:CRP-like cAMP-binding protein
MRRVWFLSGMMVALAGLEGNNIETAMASPRRFMTRSQPSTPTRRRIMILLSYPTENLRPLLEETPAIPCGPCE